MGNIVQRMPTKTDVDYLISNIGIPKEGEEVSKKTISEMLRLPLNSSRFGTIISCWKQRLFDQYNVCMISNYKGGYTAANPEDRINVSVKIREQAVTRMTKAVRIAASADTKRLSEESREIQDTIRKQIADAKLALAMNL